MKYPIEIRSLLVQSLIEPLHADMLNKKHKIDSFKNIIPYELIAKKIIEPIDAICYSREQQRALHMYSKNIIAGELTVKTVLTEKKKLLDKLISGGMESAEKLYALHLKINPKKEHQPHYDDIQRLLVITFLDKIFERQMLLDTALSLEHTLKTFAKGTSLALKNSDPSPEEMSLMTSLIQYVVQNTKTFLSTNMMVDSLEWEKVAPYICLRLFGHAHHPCPGRESIYFSTFLKMAKDENSKTIIEPPPFSLSSVKQCYFNAAVDYPAKENNGLTHQEPLFWQSP